MFDRLSRNRRRRRHDALYETISDDRLSQSFGFRGRPSLLLGRNRRTNGPGQEARSPLRLRTLRTGRRAAQQRPSTQVLNFS